MGRKKRNEYEHDISKNDKWRIPAAPEEYHLAKTPLGIIWDHLEEAATKSDKFVFA